MGYSTQRPPRIMCARCGHLVERTLWWNDRDSADLIIKVRCHGEEEEMRLPERVLLDRGVVKQLEESTGIAFKPRVEVLP